MCESCNVKKNTRSLSCVWLNHFVIGARTGLGGQAMARPLLCLLAVWLYKIIESVCLSLLCHATDCIANWSIYCLRLSEHVVLCVFTTHTLLHHDAWQNYECHYRINSIRTWIRLWSIYCLRLSEHVILCVFTTHTLVAKLWMSLLDKFYPNMNTAFQASK